MSLNIEKPGYSQGHEVLRHLDGKSGGLYVVAVGMGTDEDYYSHYLTGDAHTLTGFVMPDDLVTYFAIWRDGE
jgi:hypothetical protein